MDLIGQTLSSFLARSGANLNNNNFIFKTIKCPEGCPGALIWLIHKTTIWQSKPLDWFQEGFFIKWVVSSHVICTFWVLSFSFIQYWSCNIIRHGKVLTRKNCKKKLLIGWWGFDKPCLPGTEMPNSKWANYMTTEAEKLQEMGLFFT